MLRSLLPRAHEKYLSLPLLGPITDTFDDWLAATGFTRGSRVLSIHLLPIMDASLRRRGVHEPAIIESERALCRPPPRRARIRLLHHFQPLARHAIFPPAPGRSRRGRKKPSPRRYRIVCRQSRKTAEPGISAA